MTGRTAWPAQCDLGDFAETFAHYMIDALETAMPSAFGLKSIYPVAGYATLSEDWAPLTFAVNRTTVPTEFIDAAKETIALVQSLERRTFMPKESKSHGLKTLDELFHGTLKDIYFAEKKILSTLPKMAKAAQSEDLRAAFETHHNETQAQIERLEEVFAMIEKKPQGKTCAAIVGIVEEGAEIMQEYKGSSALDAGLLAAAQAVEHYEISRYGTLSTWAEELGLKDAVPLLQETLEEEKATDKALGEIAKTAVNQQAKAI